MPHRFPYALPLTLCLLASADPALGGGLVETGPERFADADFSDSQHITNPWWTLNEGSNFLYFAEDGEDCLWDLQEVLGTTIEAGGDFAGIYAGIDARIVLDRGWVDEDCAYGDDFDAFLASEPETDEVTYDWYAQDAEGNVWYMGEDTFDGSFDGSFVAGCDGAQAGIVLLGDPGNGDFYNQEFYEGEAEDWAKVLRFRSDDGLECMTTKEWTPLEQGHVELKHYCSDGEVGRLVQVQELFEGMVTVELVGTDVDAPPVGELPIDPAPACP